MTALLAIGKRASAPGRVDAPIATDATVMELLAKDSPVAMGVSGGKDSCALALATEAYLDALGHRGPRVLVHSDLGRVEWRDSLPTCERLADKLGLELMVMRRQAGDMMDRWLTRWHNNVERYANLECVKLILPWLTPSMRFCTSELKTAVITSALAKRFRGHAIISAAGIRREESANRAKAPISKVQKRLTRKSFGTSGIDWNPIIDWTEADVRAYCAAQDFPLHEGYTRYGMSRISCAFCIMGSIGDILASTTCPDNAAIYREMCGLELRSTFAFQGARWLFDVAPYLLDGIPATRFAAVKEAAAARELAESRIPAHLLYTEGWPTVMPTHAEAVELCKVRVEVANAVGIQVRYVWPDDLRARYAELMAANAARVAS